MIRFSREVIRRRLEKVLHVHDTPRRTAAAVALGVFIAFSPPLGLHTPLALACAFILDLNRVPVMAGAFTNLPWFLAPYYTFTTAVGARLLGTQLPADFSAQVQSLFQLSLLTGEFWYRVGVLLRPLFWPYVLGSTLGAAVLAAFTYQITLAFVIAHRRHASHR